MESVLEYVTEGNRAQMRDPAFVAELKHWIRFNESQAVSTGDGLFTRSSGNPTSPTWLGARRAPDRTALQQNGRNRPERIFAEKCKTQRREWFERIRPRTAS
jgi:hypothetical protein